MGLPGRTSLKLVAALALALAAVALAGQQLGRFRSGGGAGARVWFYDQSERQLYAVPKDTLPPHKGVGGASGDGVRAVVVVFRAEQNDPRKRRIAYLETYTPELKALLERLQAARASGRAFPGRSPARDSEFFQTNCLVKGADETEWHPSSSVEGRRIMTAWQAWRGPDGHPPIACLP